MESLPNKNLEQGSSISYSQIKTWSYEEHDLKGSNLFDVMYKIPTMEYVINHE